MRRPCNQSARSAVQDPVHGRREFLKFTAAAAFAALPRLATAHRERSLIVNADDFGESEGINRGIVAAHEQGIVTSASLMVDERATEAAVALARQHPRLDLGLHVSLQKGREWVVELQDLDAVAAEVQRQLDRFIALTGRRPTHIDSHHHVHRRFNLADVFLDLGSRNGTPVRGFCDVVYIGHFWGMMNGKPDPAHISADYLISILAGLRAEVSELSCHPGYADPDSDADYNAEREIELRALTDARVRAFARDASVRLIGYRDYVAQRSPRGRVCSQRW